MATLQSAPERTRSKARVQDQSSNHDPAPVPVPAEDPEVAGATTTTTGSDAMDVEEVPKSELETEIDVQTQTQTQTQIQIQSEGSEGDAKVEEDGELSMEVETDQESALEAETETETDVDDKGEVGNQAESDQDGAAPFSKRVKVYELRDSSWFDRGTGRCKGIYDDLQDLALILVEAEDQDEGGESKPGEEDGPGGFLKGELLLNAVVEHEEIYSRQQDTLIVWTEPATNLDIALSFQDAEGCEDIWQFIKDVQKHMNSLPSDPDPILPSSPRAVLSPPGGMFSRTWQPPTLANIKDQVMGLRMATKTLASRERAVEQIIGEDYIKALLGVFDQAEDLESLEDLHALYNLMQAIIMFNDNGIFEYILQDDIFQGVIGILEYDPEWPALKAAYRQLYNDTAKFRQVVEIKDDGIRNKIHQTFRLHFLKDVVLVRMLDDPTFNILNGFVFFNQVDIVNHIQSNNEFLVELFSDFKDITLGSPPSSSSAENTPIPLEEKKRDIVIFLHQLMLMGKNVQVPNRLALYRNLVERGLLFVCQWAFRRPEPQLLNSAAEILTLAVDHDVNAVRMHVLKEEEAKKRTLVLEIIHLLSTTKNVGLMNQLADVVRTLLETPAEADSFLQRKEGPVTEMFMTYFYDHCSTQLYEPLSSLPEKLDSADPIKLSREQATLYQYLVELLSYCVINHAHKASYFILSNPISQKVVSLLHVKEKTLRHASLRFVRACLRTPNHFIHRHFVKKELLTPLLMLLEEESSRDNMLTSSCMEVLDLIRKENIKPIINYLFEHYRSRIEALGKRPYLRSFVDGLTSRWEQNNEPPPPPQQPEAESSKSSWLRANDTQEEEYFNASDDEDTTTIGPIAPATPTITLDAAPRNKRLRAGTNGGGMQQRRAPPRATNSTSPFSPSGSASGSGSSSGSLGLDYDDGSDSDTSSNGARSPRLSVGVGSGSGSGSPWSSSTRKKSPSPPPLALGTATATSEELEEDLSDVAMRMRAKRQREEEEEEGFAGLLVGKQAQKKEAATPVVSATTVASGVGGKKEAKEKKIRLSLGFGKKSK